VRTERLLVWYRLLGWRSACQLGVTPSGFVCSWSRSFSEEEVLYQHQRTFFAQGSPPISTSQAAKNALTLNRTTMGQARNDLGCGERVTYCGLTEFIVRFGLVCVRKRVDAVHLCIQSFPFSCSCEHAMSLQRQERPCR
jgi:hypothetical protein